MHWAKLSFCTRGTTSVGYSSRVRMLVRSPFSSACRARQEGQQLTRIWAIPPKLAPVSENTVFALFANIIKQINIYSYLNHHFS